MIKGFFTSQTASRKGFTLVEMLIYLSIFLVVATASVTLLLSLNKFVDQYQIETALYRSGTNVMEQIMLNIRQADRVDLANTIEDLPDSGKLTVEHGASSTTFTLNAGALELVVDGDSLGNMIVDGVIVDDFTVYYYPLTQGEFVRVRLSLTATVGTVTKSVILYGGSVIRGSI